MGYRDGNLSNADLYPLFHAPGTQVLSLPEARPKTGERNGSPVDVVAPLRSLVAPPEEPKDASDAA